MKAIIAGYQILQRLVLPPSFRRVFGEEMTLAFADRVRKRREEGGRVAAGLTSVGEGFDLLRTAAREWRAALPRPRWTTEALFPSDSPLAGKPLGRNREPLGSTALELCQILRCWKKRPGFALATVLTLGLAIGANTGVFSVVNAVLLRPMPFQEPERLVTTQHTAPGVGIEEMLHTEALYLLYREHAGVFDEFGLYLPQAANLVGGDRPEPVPVLFLTRSTLDALGVSPALGRPITEQDEAPLAPPVVLLTHDAWEGRFGADSAIVGRTLRVDGTAREVIGVMPKDFRFPTAHAELLIPFRFDPADPVTGDYYYCGLARMAEEVTPREAEEEMNRVLALLPNAYGPEPTLLEETQLQARVVPLREAVVGDISLLLWTLLATVGLVFLIACANVANLCLVRADGQRQEVAMRMALGAGRSRLARHFLLEGLLLGLIGGVVGLTLAYGGIRGLIAISAPRIPRMEGIGMDATVLGFTLGISLLAAFLFGLFPLAQSGTLGLVAALKEGGHRVQKGHRRYRLQDLLAITQIALALVLMVGAALMFQTVHELRSADPGFDDPESLITFQVPLPEELYVLEDFRRVPRFHRLLVERIQALPGVASVGGVSSLPLSGQPPGLGTEFEDFPLAPGELPRMIHSAWVTEGYFHAMGIDLVAGRSLELADVWDQTGGVVINHGLARRLWGSENPLGRGLRSSRTEDWYRVVGVVKDVHYRGIDQPPPEITYYPTMGVGSDTTRFAWASRRMTYAIRTDGSPMDLVPAIRETVRSIDPELPIAQVQTMDEVLAHSMARASFCRLLLGISAFMALVLGIIGVYGVVSYVVTQRTREMGVRIALGAGRRQLTRLVVGGGLALAVAGTGLGILAASALTRLMQTLLFGIDSSDPETVAASAILLTAVTMIASYVPARRAASVDPVRALAVE